MPGQDLIMHEITKLIYRAEIRFSYFLKWISSYEKLYLFNINFVDFMIRINTPPPAKTRFQPHFSLLSAVYGESPKYHPNVVLLHNDRWLRNISTKFRRLLKQRSVLYF